MLSVLESEKIGGSGRALMSKSKAKKRKLFNLRAWLRRRRRRRRNRWRRGIRRVRSWWRNRGRRRRRSSRGRRHKKRKNKKKKKAKPKVDKDLVAVEGVVKGEIKELESLLKQDVYIPLTGGESEKQICAVVTKHNLLQVTKFDEEKRAHCKRFGVKFLKQKVEEVSASLADMEKELEQVQLTKKSFPCYLCNREKQKFIDLSKKSVTYSQ